MGADDRRFLVKPPLLIFGTRREVRQRERQVLPKLRQQIPRALLGWRPDVAEQRREERGVHPGEVAHGIERRQRLRRLGAVKVGHENGHVLRRKLLAP